jgi:7,8-dihydropterin-6-yl-methyl-4-(beta-D-ribofuranosyl)aminobenzene 5'-phosphate synthase
MCDDGGHAHVPPVEAVPTDADWAGEVVPLEPVDEMSVLMVCDNSVDMLLPDQGPAKRLGLTGGLDPVLDAPTLVDGKAIDPPLAEHGFSALVEIR